jgi:4-amino-4-deoxy-L-arabinose transferase-like glycosyltransferase
MGSSTGRLRISWHTLLLAKFSRPSIRHGEIILCALVLFAGLWVRARVARDWVFTGSDTYAYVGAATELREAHRFGFRLPSWMNADAAQATAPGYCRMPGYPGLIALTLKVPVGDYASIFQRVMSVQRALGLMTCLLVFLMAYRIGGRRAAWPALIVVTFHPALVLYDAAILTETLATLITTAALALVLLTLVPSRDPSKPVRSFVPLVVAGAVMGVGQLVRIDGFLVAPCLLLPWTHRAMPRAGRAVLLALIAFALVYIPWPLRNQMVFGEPHPLAGVCNVRGEPMPRTAFLDWFATWVTTEAQTPSTLYCFYKPNCVSTTSTYPAEAFDSVEERAEVQALFDLRASEGLSERVDQSFSSLAWRRIFRHPLRTLAALPIMRAFFLWVNANDQPLRTMPKLPWPSVYVRIQRYLLAYNAGLFAIGLLGLLLVARLPEYRSVRGAAWLAGTAILLRTLFLALTGFVDARYTLEVLPFVIIFASIGIAAISKWLSRTLCRILPKSAPDGRECTRSASPSCE